MGKPTYGTSFVTEEFRLAFAKLFEPEAFGKGTPKYAATMVMDAKAMKQVRKELIAVAKAKWGPDTKKWPLTLRKNDLMEYCSPNAKDGWPIRCGDDTEYEGFEGKYFVKASSTRAPGVVNTKRQPIIDAEEIHSGCICRARVTAYAFEGESDGVTLQLEHILLVKDDGTNWGSGSRVKAEDAFDGFTDNSGEDDPSNYQSTGTDDDL